MPTRATSAATALCVRTPSGGHTLPCGHGACHWWQLAEALPHGGLPLVPLGDPNTCCVGGITQAATLEPSHTPMGAQVYAASDRRRKNEKHKAIGS